MRTPRKIISFRQLSLSSSVLIILLVGFMAFAGLFAFKLQSGIIPDEPQHFALSQIFASTWGIPADFPATYAFSSVGDKAFLYYWINGRFLNILHLFDPTSSDRKELVLLRLLSIVYALGSVFFSYLIAREIIDNKWGGVLVVFFLVTTLMFDFISGGVTYDNLTNLCASGGIYYLLRVFKGEDFYKNSLGSLIWICFGALVKVTILPLAAVMGLSWIGYFIKNRTEINFRLHFGTAVIFGLSIFALLVAGNISLYGTNILRYHSITPTCDQVLTKEQCAQNLVYVRNQHLSNSNINITEILAGKYPDPILYFYNYWIISMLNKIFGILGHKNFFLPSPIITFYLLLIIFSLFTIIRYWKSPTYATGSLYIIFIFYTLVLLATNYRAEMSYGFNHLGVQGRYIFPVISVGYTLLVRSLLEVQNYFCA